MVSEKAVDVGEDAEVKFGQIGDKNVVAVAVSAEAMDETRAKEAFSACDGYSFGAEIDQPRVSKSYLTGTSTILPGGTGGLNSFSSFFGSIVFPSGRRMTIFSKSALAWYPPQYRM